MVDKKIEEVMAELMHRMTETEKLQFLSYCEGMIAKAQMQEKSALGENDATDWEEIATSLRSSQ